MKERKKERHTWRRGGRRIRDGSRRCFRSRERWLSHWSVIYLHSKIKSQVVTRWIWSFENWRERERERESYPNCYGGRESSWVCELWSRAV